ncbi:hypothetical protein [Agaribacterium sp. ZY112]|uniref:hypothetical protein n=1 Tax=Agaribacterium sp. ZY112 TaxID=3233574 RepID=UPI0035256129
MLNKAIKWAVLIGIWRRYGVLIKSIPLVLILLVVIWTLHSDFLAYVQVSKDTNYVVHSYLLKWLCIAIVAYVYWRYVSSLLQESDESHEAENTKKEKNRKGKSSFKAKKGADNSFESEVEDAGTSHSEPDPFAHIRSKEKLETKAEKIIKSKI